MDTPLVKRTGNGNVCHIAKGWVKVLHGPFTLWKCCSFQSVIWLQPERRGGGGGGLGLPRKAHFHFNLVSAWRTSASLTPILIPWLLLLQDHRDRCSARKRTSPVIFYLLLLSLIPLLKHPCQSENMQKAQMWKMLTVEGTFWLSGHSGGLVTSTQPSGSGDIQDAFILVPQFICSIHRKMQKFLKNAAICLQCLFCKTLQ